MPLSSHNSKLVLKKIIVPHRFFCVVIYIFHAHEDVGIAKSDAGREERKRMWAARDKNGKLASVYQTGTNLH